MKTTPFLLCLIIWLSVSGCQRLQPDSVNPVDLALSHQISTAPFFFKKGISLSEGKDNAINESIYFTDRGSYFLGYSWKNPNNPAAYTLSPEGLELAVSFSDGDELIREDTIIIEPRYASETTQVFFDISRDLVNKPLNLSISASASPPVPDDGEVRIAIYWYKPRLFQ